MRFLLAGPGTGERLSFTLKQYLDVDRRRRSAFPEHGMPRKCSVASAASYRRTRDRRFPRSGKYSWREKDFSPPSFRLGLRHVLFTSFLERKRVILFLRRRRNDLLPIRETNKNAIQDLTRDKNVNFCSKHKAWEMCSGAGRDPVYFQKLWWHYLENLKRPCRSACVSRRLLTIRQAMLPRATGCKTYAVRSASSDFKSHPYDTLSEL